MALPTPGSTVDAGKGFIQEIMGPALEPLKAAGSALGNPLQTLNAPPVVMAAAAAMGTMFGGRDDNPDEKLKRSAEDLTESSEELDASAKSLKEESVSSGTLGDMLVLGLENLETILADIRDSVFGLNKNRKKEDPTSNLKAIEARREAAINAKKKTAAPGKEAEGVEKVEEESQELLSTWGDFGFTLFAIKNTWKGIAKGFGLIGSFFAGIKYFFGELRAFASLSMAEGWWATFKTTKIFTKIGNFFTGVKTFFTSIGKFGAKWGANLLKFGKLLKTIPGLGWILLGIEALYFAITGFIEGWKADGLIGGIKGALTNIVGGIVDGLLNLIKDIVSWVAGFIGFDDVEATLDSWEFDFAGLTGNIFDGLLALFGYITKIVDYILHPFNAVQDLIKGEGLFTNFDISGKLSDVVQDIKDWFTDIPDAILDMVISLADTLPFGLGKRLLNFVGIDAGEHEEAKEEKTQRRAAKDVEPGAGGEEEESISRLNTQHTKIGGTGRQGTFGWNVLLDEQMKEVLVEKENKVGEAETQLSENKKQIATLNTLFGNQFDPGAAQSIPQLESEIESGERDARKNPVFLKPGELEEINEKLDNDRKTLKAMKRVEQDLMKDQRLFIKEKTIAEEEKYVLLDNFQADTEKQNELQSVVDARNNKQQAEEGKKAKAVPAKKPEASGLSELDQALIDGDDEKAIELDPRLKKRSIRSAARRKANLKAKVGVSPETKPEASGLTGEDVGTHALEYIQKVTGQSKLTQTDLDKMTKLGMVTISPGGITANFNKIRGGAYILSPKTAAKFKSKWSGMDSLTDPEATKWLNQNAEFVFTKATQKPKPIPVKKPQASGLTGASPETKPQASGLTGAATDDKSWFESGSDWVKSLFGGPKDVEPEQAGVP